MTYQANKLNVRHQQILDCCLAGYKQKDIATRLQMSACQVNLIVNAPNFQHELAIRREVLQTVKTERLSMQDEDPVVSQLKQGALSAASTLVAGLVDESATIRTKSAGEILDRAGYGKVTKIDANIKQAVVVLKSEEAKALNDTLKMINA